MPKVNTGTQQSDDESFEQVLAEPAPPTYDQSKIDELDMLRARIDEQSRLIMILKQRADDAVNKANAMGIYLL